MFDTWEWKQNTGSWGTTPPFDFISLSTQEANAWFATSVIETLNAFSELVRDWRVNFNTSYIYADKVEPVSLEWKPETSYENYIETILQAVREYPVPLDTLNIEVELFVYVRTQESPERPIRAWVRLPRNEFIILGGPENQQPYLRFETGYTLFRPLSKDYEDNSQSPNAALRDGVGLKYSSVDQLV